MNKPPKRLRIGTRGSQLALIQTKLVADALTARQPDLEIENVIIKTEGDKNQSPIPLDTVGKAWFTAEIEHALQAGEIDLAVHSLKDLPIAVSPGLTITYVLERADPRDVLITKSGDDLLALPAGAVIGTDSARRRSMLLAAHPQLEVRSLRGNVQTRLRKLHEQDYDGIIVAAAGLARLNQLAIVTEFLDPTLFIPAIGQGTLAVQMRDSDTDLHELLATLEHPPTVAASTAERTFSETVGGGCKLPIGCFAIVKSSTIRLFGAIGELDGTRTVRDYASGSAGQARALGAALANKIMEKCNFSFKP